VYDSQGGNHRTNALNYLNQGNNLVNHIDHASTDVMGVGCTNHDLYLYTSDMGGLTNGTRQGTYYSIGCWACDYAATTCIGEGWVQSTSGGGLAFVGNSRYGWYSPGSDSAFSLNYDRHFFASLFQQVHYKLGDCFSDHKADAYGSQSVDQYIFTELTLLGDPELPLWTDTPQNLVGTHAATVYAGAYNAFTVQVTCGGSPVALGTVCAWKSGDVYATALTDGDGVATLGIIPASTGSMFVTATKRNRIAYEGSVQVVPGTAYTLTVSTNGQGTVALNPPGGAYLPGTTVQLTAQPAAGWLFDHWEGALSGSTNPATIAMNGDRTVTAVFQSLLLGDVNGDGQANNFDISPFVYAVTHDEAGFLAAYPDGQYWAADVNLDGSVDNFDITPFIGLLSAP
jgi:hypothetical protein